jgi:hypothetical protein
LSLEKKDILLITGVYLGQCANAGFSNPWAGSLVASSRQHLFAATVQLACLAINKNGFVVGPVKFLNLTAASREMLCVILFDLC